MKILKKNETTTEVAKHRKEQIDEGIILAKKIDNLRDTLSKLEKQHSDFIGGMKEQLERETGGLQSRIKSQKDELVLLEEKRIKLSSPIDLTEEWTSVRRLKQELVDREIDLINRESKVEELLKRETDIVESSKKSAEYLNESRSIYETTDLLRRKMEDRKLKSDKIIDEKIKELTTKEENLEAREQVLKDVREYIQDEKKKILEKGSQLIAREANIESERVVLTERENKIKDKENHTDRLNTEAQKNYDKSDDIRVGMIKDKEAFDLDISTRYDDLTGREIQISAQEKNIALQREGIEAEKSRIEEEKLHISSQQQTLRVAWENIKKLNNK